MQVLFIQSSFAISTDLKKFSPDLGKKWERNLIIYYILPFQIKGKNQLRVNGLSFFLYFISYFIVLAALMAFMCGILLLIVLLFKTPSLSSWPALTTIGVLIMFYCPSSILFSTCVSYIFDKAESAQSIMSNVATLLGWVPFILVMILGKYVLTKF